MKYFWKNYWVMKHLGLWRARLRNFFFIFFFFFDKFVKPSGLPSYTLNVHSLTWDSELGTDPGFGRNALNT